MRWSDLEWARGLMESGSSDSKSGRERQLSFDFERGGIDPKGDGADDADASSEPEPPLGSFAARLKRYLDLQQEAARRGKDRKRTGLDK